MRKKFLVFQHSPWEKPGTHLLEAADKNRVKLDVVRVWQEAIPPLGGYDALIVLGGSPNVNQEKTYPFLKEEKQAIRNSIQEDRPYLGFCLGHQLLGDALNQKVGPNYLTSVGFVAGYLTARGREHPLFRNLPRKMKLFKWHSQTILTPLPSYIDLLATSGDCQVEAISVANRPHIVGLQFDNHAAAPGDISEWLTHDAKWLSSIKNLRSDPREILTDAFIARSSIQQWFMTLFRNFLDLLP